jgi:hypothetical protein
MKKAQPKKRHFSAIKLAEAMQLIGQETLHDWHLNASPRRPSEILLANLQRLKVFDLESSEQAKTLWIDVLFAEVVNDYPKLKIWKAEALETDTLIGVADYVIAPRRAYLGTPLLCVTEAKRDDFEKGRIQCLVEMYACQWNNRQSGLDLDVYGIVSNGQGWRFYKLTQASEVYETNQYGIEDLSGLLGALDTVCAGCTQNIP